MLAVQSGGVAPDQSPTDQVVPPPSVPLAFFAAAGVGCMGFGFSAWFAADRLITAPNHPGAVSTAHTAVLAFLTVAVLGAVHQFGPVAGRAPLRSVITARWTLIGMLAVAWLLPTGFAHGPESLILIAGVIAVPTVSAAVWNLSRPLSNRDGGVPVLGLRMSVAYLVVTVLFGVVYAFNREIGWFHAHPARVMAHAHLGLLGWLGLTYVSVAEKLWPMFLLSHRPPSRSGLVAVVGLGSGVLPLAVGLLWSISVLLWIGGGLIVTGLTGHLVSLISSLRHRRRKMELLHGFLITAMCFLTVGALAGIGAAVLPVDTATRMRLVTTEIVALVGWLGLAVIGHAHKIVPFIRYTSLRAAGIRHRDDGRPLLFSDLYRRWPARISFVSATIGFGLLVTGVATRFEGLVATGGVLVATTALIAVLNLTLLPRAVAARDGIRTGPTSPGMQPL